MGGLSNPLPLSESSLTGIDSEIGVEIGRPGDSVYASVVNVVVGA